MGKFYPLTKYLSNRIEKTIVFSFPEIEQIISEPLCYSAYTYKAYWSPSKTHMLPNAIIEAGYKIDDIDLGKQRIILKRR